jgi:uncharacterized paraquat-inducible protein A
MDAAGQHAPEEEEGYSRGRMVAACLFTVLVPAPALILALGLWLTRRRSDRKRAQLKQWVLVSVAWLAIGVTVVVLKLLLAGGDPEIVRVPD